MSFKQNKSPQVVYKSKRPMLPSEHALHLQNIYTGGLMKKVTPPDIEEGLLKSGYARRAIGGLMITEAGHKALMNWEKGGKK